MNGGFFFYCCLDSSFSWLYLDRRSRHLGRSSWKKSQRLEPTTKLVILLDNQRQTAPCVPSFMFILRKSFQFGCFFGFNSGQHRRFSLSFLQTFSKIGVQALCALFPSRCWCYCCCPFHYLQLGQTHRVVLPAASTPFPKLVFLVTSSVMVPNQDVVHRLLSLLMLVVQEEDAASNEEPVGCRRIVIFFFPFFYFQFIPQQELCCWKEKENDSI